MKRINVFWLSLLMALTALPVSAFDFEIDGIKYDITGANEVCVSSGGDKNTEVVVIPSEVTNDATTYSVTSIGENAFKFGYRPKLTSVTIPASIKKIGSNAFSGCILLTEIHISDIAAWCDIEFANEYSNPLNHKYASLLLNGEKITELIIPEGVTDIKQYAFIGGPNLTSVDIPATLKTIGSRAFDNCSSLTKTNIHDAAAWCGITFADYTANPLTTAKSLYLNGEKVTDLIIPDGTASIGAYAFYNATELSSVKLSNSLTEIGSNSFHGCTGLTSVTIPSSVTSIKEYAFKGCSALTSAVFEDGDATTLAMEANTFEETALQKAYIGRILSGSSPFRSASKLSEVTIGNTVTSLGYKLFSGCTSLTSVSISNSVILIGYSCFSDCTGLTSITIPNSVTDIEGACFSGCTGLTSITIPNSVTDMAGNCFYGCTGLTSITIPNSLTYIPGSCFENCTGLTSITIPNGVTSIEEMAFRGCFGLTSVDIPNSITEIGPSSFGGCTGLTAVNIHDMAAWCNINFYSSPLFHAHNLYLNGELVTDLVIPEGVTSDMSLAFAQCTSLTSVVISDGLDAIGRFAFDGCTNLTSVTIPGSVTKIGYLPFRNCGLTSIYLLNATPPSANGDSFDANSYQAATLYVPMEAAETYRTTDPWKNFTNIQGMDMSGIKGIKADGGARQNTYYDLNGRKLNGPKTGLNIINGKKVMVKNEK